MGGSHIPNGLMVIFTITTVVVFLYPIIKLTPSWLERSMAKRIILHREALAAIGTAMEQSRGDAAQLARLQAQHDYHVVVLRGLVPGEAAAAVVERKAA